LRRYEHAAVDDHHASGHITRRAASAYLAAGRPDAARRAADRCHRLHGGGEGGIEPVIEGLESGAVELTARERQLVNLAARGLSNAEFADRLVLSVRTVESHLYRAMHKLGMTNRRQLITRAHSTQPRLKRQPAGFIARAGFSGRRLRGVRTSRGRSRGLFR
jgi:DNA-binding CsgD family transcriptional regulator